MNRLDETTSETYRLSLLDELVHERFPVIPIHEAYRRPMPLPYVLVRSKDSQRRIAERQRALRADWRMSEKRAA